MRKIYDAFAAGKPTAKDDLIRAIIEEVYSDRPDTEKVCRVRSLLRDSFAGATEHARGFDVEVD